MAQAFVRDDWLVLCLCAEWCGTCRDYRKDFDALGVQTPGIHFRWLDIEEDADALSGLDIENFPTLLIARAELILFFGMMPPQIGHLHRALEAFRAQTREESRAYAQSGTERQGWQTHPDLRSLVGS